MKPLDDQVAQLRREVRRLKLLLLAFLAVTVLAGFSDYGERVVRLVSEGGDREVVLTPSGLDFLIKSENAGGNRIVHLRITPEEIQMIGEDGDSRAFMTPNRLGLLDNGRPRAVIEGCKGKYRLAFANKEQAVRAVIGVDGDKPLFKLVGEPDGGVRQSEGDGGN